MQDITKTFVTNHRAAIEVCRTLGRVRQPKIARGSVKGTKILSLVSVPGLNPKNQKTAAKELGTAEAKKAGWKWSRKRQEFMCKVNGVTTIYFSPTKIPLTALVIEQTLSRKSINQILGFAPIEYTRATQVLVEHWLTTKNFDLSPQQTWRLKKEPTRRRKTSLKLGRISTSALISELADLLARKGYPVSNTSSAILSESGFRIRITGSGKARVWKSRGLGDTSINDLLVRRHGPDVIYNIITSGHTDTKRFIKSEDVGWNMAFLSKLLTRKNVDHSYNRRGKDGKNSVVSSLFKDKNGQLLWSVSLKRINKELVWMQNGCIDEENYVVGKSSTIRNTNMMDIVKQIARKERIARETQMEHVNPYVILRVQAREVITELHGVFTELGIFTRMLPSGLELIGDNFRVRLSHTFLPSKRRWLPKTPKLFWYLQIFSAYGEFVYYTPYTDLPVHNFATLTRTFLSKVELLGNEQPATELEVMNYLPTKTIMEWDVHPNLAGVEEYLLGRSFSVPFQRVGKMLSHTKESSVSWMLGVSEDSWNFTTSDDMAHFTLSQHSVEDMGRKILRHVNLNQQKFVSRGDTLPSRNPIYERWLNSHFRTK